MFKKMASITCFTVFFVLGFFLFSGMSNAAIHYVSPTGKATWADSTNINTTCSVAIAFANAVAGDTVYFRGGTYDVPKKDFGGYLTGYYQPSNSGTAGNPIIFMAYPGETPLLNGTSGGSGELVSGPDDYATILGNGYKNYIAFDGFSFQANGGTRQAHIVLVGTDMDHYATGLVVKNCTFNGGSNIPTQTDNRDAIFIQNTNGTLIQRCKIYNYKEMNNAHNTSAIKMYHNSNSIIENCEIYDSVVGIYSKSLSTNCVFRYNYIHKCFKSIYFDDNYNQRGNKIYHNVLVNKESSDFSHGGPWCIRLDMSSNDTNGLEIYNNTFYATQSVGGLRFTKGSIKIYNNIFYGSNAVLGINDSAGKIEQGDKDGTWKNILECDYNLYSPVAIFRIWIRLNYTNTHYDSFAAWQVSKEVDTIPASSPDAHGLYSDPKFVNGTGSFIQLSDFRLATDSPCKGRGKGGVDMGADIDLIVLPPGNTPPAPPKGLKIVQ